MIGKSLQGIGLLAALLVPQAHAQTRPLPPSEKLAVAAMDRVATKSLGDNVFGETLSLSTGSLGFEVTDIDIPGNGPPVQLTRIYERSKEGGPRLNKLTDWDLHLPRITTTGANATGAWHTAASLWNVQGNAQYARCSNFGPPRDFVLPHYGSATAATWWSGAEIRLPGQAAKPLLKRSPTFTLAPNGNPAAYPIITADGWAISCLPATRNGAAGEAFLAHSPDGLTYRFDWFTATPLRVSKGSVFSTVDPENMEFDFAFPIHVFEVNVYPTRVSDRFGNYVDYTYQGYELVKIAASDGRTINLSYANDEYGYPKLRTASVPGAQPRTWQYQYGLYGRLSAVVLPDGTAWRISERLLGAQWDTSHRAITMHAPSGLVGEFKLRLKPKQREASGCSFGGEGTIFSPLDPCFVYVDGLFEKRYTGPGVDATWRYHYLDWPKDRTYTVVDEPDGTRTMYTIGNSSLSALDGRILRKDEGAIIVADSHQGWIASKAERSTIFDFQTAGARVGTAPQAVANRAHLEHQTFDKRRTIRQGGADFARSVDAVDTLSRPLRITDVGTSTSRTTTIVYHDDTASWTLGQIARRTINGVVEQDVSFTTKALPHVVKTFGSVDRVLAWRDDGTLLSASDGRDSATFDTTVTYGPWRRGMPTWTRHADGATVAVTIDDHGSITSTTNETGAKTCFAYDAMGRLKSTTYPSETASGVCDTSASNVTQRTFAASSVAARGLPAGHWQETVSTGNARQVTYYDALWRPVLTHAWDTADAGNTSRQVVTRYDAMGRKSFESYPVRDVANVAQSMTGTRMQYDALDRITRVEQDSEIGPLVTTTTYLTNAQGQYTLVTNPRGHQTRTWFQMFDQPDYANPNSIHHPGGAVTDILRDVFGKPTSITRRSSNGAQSLTRSFTYDTHQRLCRTTEPETGSTFQGYDAAGNLAWSASGYATTSAGCSSAAGVAARRIDRTYDARNRVATVRFPDGLGDLDYVYEKDGLPASITARNVGVHTVTTKYAYNQRRQTKQELLSYGSIQWPVDTTYDRNGHVASQRWNGIVVDHAPNALGQPTRAGTYATGVRYHPNGAMSQFTYGNGIVHTLTQNARQWPDVRRDSHGGTDVLRDEHDYDGAGNVAAITDGATGRGQRGNRKMTYDAMDRLSSVTSPMFGTASYQHDALDNITRLTIGGAAARDHWYCRDAKNRLTNVKLGGCAGTSTIGLGYDVQGNLANKNGATYTFDFGNRLRQATVDGGVSSYVYDGHGRRVLDVAPGGNKYSHYTNDGRLVRTNDGRAKKSAMYFHLNGTLVAVQERDTTTGVSQIKYQHTDQLGTPVVVTDANRNVVERSEYEPYGKVVNRPRKDGPGFTGHVEDKATGLMYAQQRYFDPEVPQFLSVDPVTAYGGDWRYFNTYRYAFNNPYRHVDPDGRAVETAWDVFNVGIGIASLVQNVHAGNWSGAAVDGLGVLADGAATVIPVVPAGVGTAIRVARATDAAASAAKSADVAKAAAPDFIVTPGGTAFPVPTGASGPTPSVNSAGKVTGAAFQGGAGGANGQVWKLRLMDPTPPMGRSPGYPNGYVKYENAGGQGVDPYLGRTLPNSASHYPID